MGIKPKTLPLLLVFVAVSAIIATVWIQSWLPFYCGDLGCRKDSKSWKFYIGCKAYLRPPKRAPFLKTVTEPASSRNNWMSRYQNQRLGDLVLPGSHHTGVNRKHGRLLESWDIPQLLSVSDQLKIGVRFFDLRISTGPSLQEPTITHNYQYQRLADLMQETVTFLKQNPTEVVVMNIQSGKNNSLYYFYKFNWIVEGVKVDSVLSTYQRYIYQENNPLNKTIGKLKGKIVICESNISISGFRSAQCLGSYHFTKSSAPLNLISKLSQWLPKRDSTSFFYLEAVVTPSVTDVIDALNPFSCKSKGSRKEYTFRNLQEVSENANWFIYQWVLRNKLQGKVNGIITDFVHLRLVNAIIGKNKERKREAEPTRNMQFAKRQ